jgi:hypothetical protein
MKTMKLWRKSRLSECHANSFANGRTGTIYVIAFMMLAAFSLASCSSNDDDKDIVEQVTIFVSAETGTYNVVPSNTFTEGMLIREQGESAFYCVSFQTITGFTYERGHEYELLVKRTTLANPPQDSGKYRYELVRIVSDKENGKA